MVGVEGFYEVTVSSRVLYESRMFSTSDRAEETLDGSVRRLSASSALSEEVPLLQKNKDHLQFQ